MIQRIKGKTNDRTDRGRGCAIQTRVVGAGCDLCLQLAGLQLSKGVLIIGEYSFVLLDCFLVPPQDILVPCCLSYEV